MMSGCISNRLLAVFFVSAWSGCGSGETVAVSPASISPRVVARAVLEPRSGIAQLVAEVPGRVTNIAAHVGDRVAAGATLLEMQPPAQTHGAESETITTLRAPFAGIVLAVQVDVGDDVSVPGPALVDIAAENELTVRFELEPDDAFNVPRGAVLEVRSPGGRELLGRTTVARLSPTIAARSVGVANGIAAPLGLVRSGWANLETSEEAPNRNLLLGREVEVTIERPSVQVATSLPRSAVGVREGVVFVRTPGSFGDAIVPVVVGIADETTVEISGLAAGLQVRRYAGM